MITRLQAKLKSDAKKSDNSKNWPIIENLKGVAFKMRRKFHGAEPKLLSFCIFCIEYTL